MACAAAPSAGTAHRVSSARWRPSTTGPTGEPAPASADARARTQRLRPARPQRQPLPLHRVPPDPGRRLRPRPPCARRRARPPGDRPGARAGRHPPVAGRAASSSGPTDLARALALLGEHPDAVLVAGSTDWGVDVNLRGARAPFVIAIDRAAGAAWADGRRRRHRDRRRAHPQRGRTRPRRPGPPPRPALPAVRLTAHPQRCDASAATSPRHPPSVTPHRRCSRWRPRRCSCRRRRARGAARRLLHRVPADRAAPRRADPRRPDPAAAQRGHRVPQDRQAALRRHLERGRRHRPRRAGRGGRQGADRARRRRGHARCGPAPPRRRSRGGRGPRRPCASAAEVDGAARARPSTTTGPARPTARPCSAPRCCGCTRGRRAAGGGGRMSSALRPSGPTPSWGRRSRTSRRPCTSPGRRSTPTTSSERTPGVLHAHPVQAPHAHARVTGLRTRTGPRRARGRARAHRRRRARASTTPASRATSRCSRAR